jgi:hypothetical protein
MFLDFTFLTFLTFCKKVQKVRKKVVGQVADATLLLIVACGILNIKIGAQSLGGG